jgi:hypothetical protein
MQNVNEITLLKEGNVKITSSRVMIGTKSYALSDIMSVRVHENEPRLFTPIFFMLMVGVCLALVALTNMQELSHYLTIGSYIGVTTFILFLLSRKTKYSVRVKSSVGELNILEAQDKDHVEKIVGAMNEAIINRQ